MDFLIFMAAPFVTCLILVGIHAYLGIHVLTRGVIFVDLALAQISALGAAVAVLLGYELDSTSAYYISLLFTFVGAAVFSLTRVRHERIPQEAIIGIAYAVAAAAVILVMDRAPHGAEHIKDLLVGSILFVTWPKVLKTAAIYSAIGLFHWLFREKFLLISFDPEQAKQKGISLKLWDFLFYASFGFVVTSSVQIAGVLLVFSFLIVPAVGGMLLSSRLNVRLALGWIIGVIVSIIGCSLSYGLNLPTGATVVCTFGMVLVASALGKQIWTAIGQKVRWGHVSENS
ncbi:metal ABC transporter permease [Candidatus Poribacteria bacterium]|nr:metal ABC transporter permease [Candidatus Poribacteria bacterium]